MVTTAAGTNTAGANRVIYLGILDGANTAVIWHSASTANNDSYFQTAGGEPLSPINMALTTSSQSLVMATTASSGTDYIAVTYQLQERA